MIFSDLYIFNRALNTSLIELLILLPIILIISFIIMIIKVKNGSKKVTSISDYAIQVALLFVIRSAKDEKLSKMVDNHDSDKMIDDLVDSNGKYKFTPREYVESYFKLYGTKDQFDVKDTKGDS